MTVRWPGRGPVSISSAIYGKRKTGIGNVRFTLLDVESGAPISGAAVSIVPSGSTAPIRTTGVDGSCSWTDLPSGYASVEITHSVYFFDTATFSTVYVTPDQWNSFVRYGQSPLTTVVLTVVLHDGGPIPNATVTLDRSGVIAASGQTNADGQVTFDSLLVGAYTIDVDYPSHVEDPGSIEITTGNYEDLLTFTVMIEPE